MLRRALVGGLLVAVAACGGGGNGNRLFGTWAYVSGPAFTAGAFADDDTNSTPRYLVLDPDGRATLIRQEQTSEVVFCTEGVFTFDDEALFLQLDLRFEWETTIFRLGLVGGEMHLKDSAGNTSVFAAVGSLPAAFRCGTLTEHSRHAGLSEFPSFFTGLAWDGASLWFTTDDYEVVPISPLTGVVGPPIFFGFDQFRHVHAAQGTDLWIHCGCGHNEEAKRKTQAGVVLDTVDTLDDLGEELALHAIAFDPANSTLWLQGFSFLLQNGRIMKVSSDLEPDVLVQTVDFDVRLRSWTWDGTWLWGITLQQSVVRIDPVTLKSVATYESPDPSIEWAGIASAPATAGGGASLYLIGQDDLTSEGVLIEVQP